MKSEGTRKGPARVRARWREESAPRSSIRLTRPPSGIAAASQHHGIRCRAVRCGHGAAGATCTIAETGVDRPARIALDTTKAKALGITCRSISEPSQPNQSSLTGPESRTSNKELRPAHRHVSDHE